ncbi:outer membrane protein [Hyphomicrobium facile]|uniref:Opacity protein n=1 Tax=Hyphomicrobium facile TaxID=51670 RepID=A0A1I7MZP7_9HYPH|nr:outer membrane beta-barrel protein [Hyphomicrobium facile]SFV27907.1 Opacity protein [Hyphomicrobium facile]
MLFTRNVLVVSAALVLGSALGASAADLGGTSLKDAPIMEAMPAASAGWYIRADGGYNWFTTPSVSFSGREVGNASQDGAWSVGGGIGRYFGRGFRGDITVDHIFDSTSESSLYYSPGNLVGNSKFDLSSTVVLANLYYDFNRGGRFIPYIGAGIGYAHNSTSSGTFEQCGCTTEFDGKSTNNFAAAAMAGVSWRIRGGQTTYVSGMKDEPVAVSSGNALYLDFGYRFLYLGKAETASFDADTVTSTEKLKDITAHQLRVGLRYDLN